MEIALGEFFDWATKRSYDETPVLVAAHFKIDWYITDITKQPKQIKISEWIQGWEVDDLLDRLELHNLGKPKAGYDSWVIKRYKNEEFLAKINYIAIWTISRVYLGVTGYDGIEGLQSWNRDELRKDGWNATGYSKEEGLGETVSADPVNYEFKEKRILTPTTSILEVKEEFL